MLDPLLDSAEGLGVVRGSSPRVGGIENEAPVRTRPRDRRASVSSAFSFGAFVPEAETPSRFLRGLTMFLDFLGPFSIWGLVVTIIGASVLSGVPRPKVAWTLGIVNVVLWIVFAALSAAFGPGA